MLYKKVMQDLKSRIDSEEFAIGDTLPTERDLIDAYSVSRITVRKAIEELVKLGLVEKRQGAGSTIIGKTMTGSMSNLRSTSEYMSDAGSTLEYKVVEFTLADPDEDVAAALKIGMDEKVYFIRRFKLINGVPSIYEDSYMPVAMFPQMNIMSLQGSKYQYLEKDLGLQIDGALQDFEAVMPDSHLCEVFEIPSDVPIIRLLSTGKLKDGSIFEYTKLYFKPNTYSYKHYLKR
ncbi:MULTISPECIES: GntR family transcriptional regulator [Vibrio]|uniref:GntR family transcriptional regulator n=1 Tax=Vibrio TaxID=662 RepID=UPI001F4326BC|nr:MULTISPECIES: GntR family transcriptional regulator [Vibrio]USD59510.1 GntR family transcriptional regulator [Vibrio sp. SCSIO 43140]